MTTKTTISLKVLHTYELSIDLDPGDDTITHLSCALSNNIDLLSSYVATGKCINIENNGIDVISVEGREPHVNDVWSYGQLYVRKSNSIEDWYVLSYPKHANIDDWVGLAHIILGLQPGTHPYNSNNRVLTYRGGPRLAINRVCTDVGHIWEGYSPRNDNDCAEGTLIDWKTLAFEILRKR